MSACSHCSPRCMISLAAVVRPWRVDGHDCCHDCRGGLCFLCLKWCLCLQPWWHIQSGHRLRDIRLRSVCQPLWRLRLRSILRLRLRSVCRNGDAHFHHHRFHAPADFLQRIQSRADMVQLRCCVCCCWHRLLHAAAAALAVGVYIGGNGVSKCGSCGCSGGQRWLPLRRRVRRRRRRQRRSCGNCGCSGGQRWLPRRRRVRRRRRRQRWRLRAGVC